MFTKMKKGTIFISIFVILSAILYFYYSNTIKQNIARAKCPDQYPNTDAGSAEYLVDFNAWTNDFYNKNPQAGLSDWSQARYQFWVDNDCTESIRRYNEAKNGMANPDQMKLIKETIKPNDRF